MNGAKNEQPGDGADRARCSPKTGPLQLAYGWPGLVITALPAALFFGAGAAFVWLKVDDRQSRKVKALAGTVKISCPGCGTHLQFALQNLGQSIACPRCRAPVLLRRPGQLKMACYFCQGRIEFPSHALGQKMPCPHCQMDITLKEKTSA